MPAAKLLARARAWHARARARVHGRWWNVSKIVRFFLHPVRLRRTRRSVSISKVRIIQESISSRITIQAYWPMNPTGELRQNAPCSRDLLKKKIGSR
jgi:hypothetical protein